MVSNDDEPFRCHYEVLGVGPDADASAIKKAHRKLALRWHPDKVRSRDDDPVEAAREFRYVQRAYECLSDDAERRWYDDHRDALLRGWTASGGGDAAAADLSARLFDLVVPFRRAGAWTTNDADADDGFFGVYGKVFASVLRAEREVDLDADLPAFGSSDADHGTVVSVFYAAWESFSTAHAFAWEDEYDTTNDHADQCRRVRRLMEEDNKKKRRARRREYNDEVRGLVGFVKRRDPRVIRHRERVGREKQKREAEEKASRKERRSDARRARELWREEQRREMEETERRDLEAGKFRLADDDDHDDEESRKGRRKGGRQKQKQKRKKRGKKNRGTKDWDTDTSDDDADTNKNADVDSNEEPTNNEDDDVENAVDEDGEPSTPTPPTRDETIPDYNDDDDETETETDDEPPDVWRCDVCRKDFKSEGQMNNHLRSKKCREAHKKHQKRLEQEARRRQKQQKEEEEAAAVNDLMEGLEVT